MVEERLKTALGIGDIVKNLAHNRAPALLLSLFGCPQLINQVELFFALKGTNETRANRITIEPAAEAAANVLVDTGRRRVGMQQRADRVKNDPRVLYVAGVVRVRLRAGGSAW